MSAHMTVTATIPAEARIDIEKMARLLPPEELAAFRGPNPAAQFDRLIERLQEDIECELYVSAADRWRGGNLEVVDSDAVVKALVAARILGPMTAIEEAAWAVGADLDDDGHVQPDLFGGDAA